MALEPWEITIEDGKLAAYLHGDLDVNGILSANNSINIPFGQKITFGDGDSYIKESSDDVFGMYLLNTQIWSFTPHSLGNTSTTGRPILYRSNSSLSTVGHSFNGDYDTGLCWLGPNHTALVAGAVNALDIVESAGVVEISGAGFNKWVTYEPYLDENTANVANKPTLITRGLFNGYSLPEYASGEELLFRMRVPFTWDGSTNPHISFITSISAAEDVNDKYKFQLEWQSEDIGAIIPSTTQETLTDEVTVTNGAAYFAEIITFELDASTIIAGQNLQFRLRRIAASSSSVSNEIIIWHWTSRWKRDKMGTESQTGY